MQTRSIVVTVATVVALAALAPASPVFAADQAVAGVVTLDGAPIGAVEVGWYDPATREHGETVAAADGSYALAIPDAHSYVLYAGLDRTDTQWKSVGKDAYVGVFVGAGRQDYLFQGLPLLTGQPASAAIDLDKPGAIAGLAPGTRSLTVYTGAYDIIDSTKPDKASGAYSVTGLIPGTYFVEAQPAKASTGDPFVSAPITVAAGAITNVVPDYSVRTTGTITGVVTSGGKPVGHIAVSASNVGVGGTDTTDSKGRYSISRLPAGRYDLSYGFPAEGAQPGTYRTASESATVTAAKKTVVNQSLEKGGTITGTVKRPGKATSFSIIVLDSKSRPLSTTTVAFDQKKAATSFVLRGVKKGAARSVLITNNDRTVYARSVVRVTGTAAKLGTVRLSTKTLTLSGAVTGATTGQVYASVGKTPASITTSASGAASANSTRAPIRKGKYTLHGVLPGVTTIVTTAADHKARLTRVSVSRSATKTLRVGTSFANATLSGTFLIDGRPLPLGEITLGTDDRDFGSGGIVEITNGVGTGYAVPAKTWIIHLDTNSMVKEFPTGSPFYLSFPAATARQKFTPGQVVDLETVNLTINR